MGTGDLLAIASDGETDHVRTGRLHADAPLRDGTWSIADLPFTRGRRNRDDPAFAFWRSLS